jgi:hypothetical protein
MLSNSKCQLSPHPTIKQSLSQQGQEQSMKGPDSMKPTFPFQLSHTHSSFMVTCISCYAQPPDALPPFMSLSFHFYFNFPHH